MHDIPERQAPLDALHARVFPVASPAATAPGPVVTLALADGDVVALARAARNGAKFAALWSGDRGGYGSASEADAALVGLLAFYTGPDPARLDRLFRASGLYRPKWDERRGAATYGERTIALCLQRGEYYTPRRLRLKVREVAHGRA